MSWVKPAAAMFALAMGCVAPATAADHVAIDRYAADIFERSGLPGMALAMIEGDPAIGRAAHFLKLDTEAPRSTPSTADRG